ncbi:MAG: MATE family efflux transporter [Desulfurococcales archaeon]|nr:MATE family efflux transporter [Desulfurococcales archaeon]
MKRVPDWGLWRRALAIALPLMLAEAVDSILWLVDTYFVSGLGDEAIEAVGVGGYLSWLLFSVGSMVYTGALVVTAQAMGAGRRGDAARALGEALALNAALALPVAGLAWAASPGLVDLLAGPRVSPEARMLAVGYFRFRLAGLPFLYAGLALDAGYRGAGVTRPVMAATAATAVVNAGLDPVLIYGMLGAPRLGVRGAALASAAASVVYLASLYAAAPGALGFEPRPRPPSRLSRRMVEVGLPTLVERLVFVGGNLAYLGAVARCGDAALAAHTIGVRVESLAFLPLYSIGESAATLSGQSVGGGDTAGGRRAGLEVAKLNALAGAATAAVLAGLSGVLPGAFTGDPRVAGLAALYLRIAAASEPAFAVSIALSMAIRGAGNTVVPTLVNLASLYLLRVLPAAWLPRHMPPGLCAAGAWAAMLVDQAGRAAITLAIYRRLYRRLARRVV